MRAATLHILYRAELVNDGEKESGWVDLRTRQKLASSAHLISTGKLHFCQIST